MSHLSRIKACAAELFKSSKRRAGLALMTLPLLGGCAVTISYEGQAETPKNMIQISSSPAQTLPGSGGPDQPGVIDRSDGGMLTREWVCDAGSGLGSYVQLTQYYPKKFLVYGKTGMRDLIKITPQGFTDFYYTDQPHMILEARGDTNGNTQSINFRGPDGAWSALRGAAMPAQYAQEFTLADERAKAAEAIVRRNCSGTSFPEDFHEALAVPRRDGMATEFAIVQLGNARLNVYPNSFVGVVDGQRVSGSGDLFKTVILGNKNGNFSTVAINGVNVPAYTWGYTGTSSPGFSEVTRLKPAPTPEQAQIFEKIKGAIKLAEPLMSPQERAVGVYFPSANDSPSP